MDYVITMYNSKKNRNETYTTQNYDQDENGLEIFKLFLDTFVEGGYSIINYFPKVEQLSKEQRRILTIVFHNLDTREMGIFVSGPRSLIVTDKQKERITFYSETDGGAIYDDFHKIDLTAVVDQQ